MLRSQVLGAELAGFGLPGKKGLWLSARCWEAQGMGYLVNTDGVSVQITPPLILLTIR